MIRPAVLYHASENKNIEIFEPKAETVRDPEEGPVIFATPDKILASIFIVPTNDSWAQSGLFNGIHYFVCSDREKFKKLDKGGAIYTLLSDTFEYNPSKGLREKEWVSKLSVKPIDKEEFKSGLEAMLNFGVQVFFVDKETFKVIEEADDHGLKILSDLRSVNQERNLNVKPLR